MAGFIRRYGYFPGSEVITQIEGVIIIDTPPPGSISAVGVGTVGLLGEFADMHGATDVDTAGVISTKTTPQEIFTPQDMLNKVGGFDDTLGDWGGSLGNGFAAIKNKRYSRLVLVPVNLASAQGARFWRELPVCTSATNANPVVPVTGGTISAAREFRVSTARLKIGTRVEFTAKPVITSGTGGDMAAGASASVQTFNAAAGFDWTLIDRGDGTLGARKGDILVLGNNNAGALSTQAGTYRVAADPASGVAISVERLDGAAFAWTAVATVPWRLHVSTDADSAPVRVLGAVTPGGYKFSEAGGYVVPLRPITDSTGAQTDGTYTAGTLMTPETVPDAITGTSAAPLSGLGGAMHPTTATAFTAAVQGINPASSASIDAIYQTALDSLLTDEEPARSINIVGAARKSSTIRSSLKTHAKTSSENGRGRVAVISPDLGQLTITDVLPDIDPGVGANRDERVFYAWPGARHFVKEAVDYILSTSDGLTTDDGIMDDSFDHWLMSLLSVLPPERNPGQAAEPVKTVFSPILGFQRGVSGLGINEYTQMRALGIAGLRIDRTAGPIVQSGITTSLTSGEKNINRRRMDDFLTDSIAERLVQFSKLPITTAFKDDVVSETHAFLTEMLSPNNASQQRIADFEVDDVSGNTPESEAKGIFVLIIRVRTLATSDFIVLQAEIGESVQITSLAA